MRLKIPATGRCCQHLRFSAGQMHSGTCEHFNYMARKVYHRGGYRDPELWTRGDKTPDNRRDRFAAAASSALLRIASNRRPHANIII